MGGYGADRPTQTVVQPPCTDDASARSGSPRSRARLAPDVNLTRGQLQTLSTDELFRLRREAQDPAVLEELVRRFEPLARSVARRYHSRGEPLEDLTQVANVGLLKAIAKFDPSKGYAFTSYATPTM